MRASRQISTGKIIEAQSHAKAGTLIQNAVNCGIPAGDVQEIEMSQMEYAAAIKAQEWGNDLAAAKARRIKEIRIEARKILSEHTDWYVVRQYETGAVIPAPVTTYRAAVRQAAQDSAAAINAMSTIDAVRDYKPAWPDAPGE